MNTYQRLIKSRTALVLDQPFFGRLALELPFIENGKIETMETDGTSLEYNPTWIDSLSTDEIKAVLCHEVMHLACAHHCRRGAREFETWNKAADYAINQIIIDAGLKLPRGCLIDPQYAGISADDIYSKIYRKPQKKQDDQQGQGNDDQGQQESPGQQGTDPGKCGGVKDFPGDKGEATQTELDQQAVDWQIKATQAAQQAKAYGKLPGSLQELINGMNSPKVPWREALQRFINQATRNDYTWKRPNSRYFSRGLILPSLYNEDLPPILLAIDTSGSISQEDLQQFAGEIEEILSQYNNARIEVLYCDTQIHNRITFTAEDRPIKLEVLGRGGTDFAPVMDYAIKAEEQPACLVYLTDMECNSYGEDPGIPVLWVSTQERLYFGAPPFGEVIFM